jgi:hypothetical protein
LTVMKYIDMLIFMIIKKTRKNLKNKWVRLTLGFLSILFAFQFQQTICSACLTGECGAIKITQDAEEKMPCHEAMPKKPCHSEDSDKESTPSESVPDGCSSCQCQIRGAVELDQKFALAPSSPVSPDLVLLVSRDVESFVRPIDLGRIDCLDPPGPVFRLHPIFILNSSFLI